MDAAYYAGNGKIEVGECKLQTLKATEVRVKIAFCGICGTDLHIFHGKMDQRVDIPQVIGHEASGIIAELGTNVKKLSVGQKVTVMPLDWCGECPACDAGHSHICQNLDFLGIDTPGAFQEYWTVPARVVLPLPEDIDLKLAALIEPLAVALHDIRLGEVKAGDFVAVIGGGPIGALIAMVAKREGAEVLVSEINQCRLTVLEKLGLETVNPLEKDIEALIKEKTAGRGADTVFEVTAHPSGVETAVKLLRTRGRIVIVGIFADAPKVDLFQFFWRELKLCGVRVYEREDYEKAIELVTAGELPLEIIVSAIYPLEKLEEGLREMEKDGENMKILIKCSK